MDIDLRRSVLKLGGDQNDGDTVCTTWVELQAGKEHGGYIRMTFTRCGQKVMDQSYSPEIIRATKQQFDNAKIAMMLDGRSDAQAATFIAHLLNSKVGDIVESGPDGELTTRA